jgi:hypothetical protein
MCYTVMKHTIGLAFSKGHWHDVLEAPMGVHFLRIAAAAARELARGACSANHSQRAFDMATYYFILHWERNIIAPGFRSARSLLLSMRDVPTAGHLIVASLENYAELIAPTCSFVDAEWSPAHAEWSTKEHVDSMVNILLEPGRDPVALHTLAWVVLYGDVSALEQQEQKVEVHRALAYRGQEGGTSAFAKHLLVQTMRRSLLPLKLACKGGAKKMLARLGGLDTHHLISILLFAIYHKDARLCRPGTGYDARHRKDIMKEYQNTPHDVRLEQWPTRPVEKRDFFD